MLIIQRVIQTRCASCLKSAAELLGSRLVQRDFTRFADNNMAMPTESNLDLNDFMNSDSLDTDITECDALKDVASFQETDDECLLVFELEQLEKAGFSPVPGPTPDTAAANMANAEDGKKKSKRKLKRIKTSTSNSEASKQETEHLGTKRRPNLFPQFVEIWFSTSPCHGPCRSTRLNMLKSLVYACFLTSSPCFIPKNLKYFLFHGRHCSRCQYYQPGRRSLDCINISTPSMLDVLKWKGMP